jgi:muramoyltetrapeptide carboxypeptidase
MPGRIYIFSPCGPVRDRTAFRRGFQRLIQMGYAVDIDPDALGRGPSGRLAGTDEQRLASMERAAHSGADVALITRGGYGAMRLLPHLPYQAMAQAAQNGLRWMGLSDFTAIQLALWARTGTISYAGPALCGDFGVSGAMDRLTQQSFEQFMTLCQSQKAEEASPTIRWTLSVDSGRDWLDRGLQTQTPLNGLLWGGNLTLVSALLGTPYCPSIQGGLLFLEEVNEPPWRVERLLAQLLHAGILTQQKAVILGSFTAYRLLPQDRGHGMKQVVTWLRSQVACPVLTQLPFGHGPQKVILPIGQEASLSLEKNQIQLKTS